MYRALVVSVLLYRSEALSTTLADRRRLDVFDMLCQWRLLRVFWQHHISNRSIRERTTQPTASSLLRQRRLRWFGHLHRMPSSIPTKQFMAGKHQEVAPKRDGLIPLSTSSIVLASTPPMLPRWSVTDPSGMPLLADCQRSNPNKASILFIFNIFESFFDRCFFLDSFPCFLMVTHCKNTLLYNHYACCINYSCIQRPTPPATGPFVGRGSRGMSNS